MIKFFWRKVIILVCITLSLMLLSSAGTLYAQLTPEKANPETTNSEKTNPEKTNSEKLNSERSLTGPVLVLTIHGPITPATDDFLKTSLAAAVERNAAMLVLELNTPGGLVTSMQSMVEQILKSHTPVMVYVSPSGGGAISAGAFITMAGHLAVMSPGTNIGAAHPVQAGGQEMTKEMNEKVENFAVSLIKAIATERGRNANWAEEAVRKSVAITDGEALDKKVIDYLAGDLNSALVSAEGRKIKLAGRDYTMPKVSTLERHTLEMTFKQQVASVLSDPNIAILLGLGAMLGITIELYHPGVILPGVVGVTCLILSLIAGQILPLNSGGVALLILGFIFFAAELFSTSFGVFAIAGLICTVLGAIYVIDTSVIWGAGSIEVDYLLLGSAASLVGCLLLILSYLAISAQRRKSASGKAGMVGQRGKVLTNFVRNDSGRYLGKVAVFGEIWDAESATSELLRDTPIEVKSFASSRVLTVEKVSS
ncbi:nodulation protein NfeD [bacterium]|nr:nodulation protein NfeD [bacterium]